MKAVEDGVWPEALLEMLGVLKLALESLTFRLFSVLVFYCS